MEVEVRLYATLRKYHPKAPSREPIILEMAEGATLAQLLESLSIPEREIKLAFVNGIQQEWGYTLRPGDRVGIFPPVAGGVSPAR